MTDGAGDVADNQPVTYRPQQKNQTSNGKGRRLVAGLFGLALLAGACGSEGDDMLGSSGEDNRSDIDSSANSPESGASGNVAGGATEAESSENETADAGQADSTDAQAEETATPPVAIDHRLLDPADAQPDADGSCLVGTWTIEEAELDRWYDSLEEDAAGLEFQISGTVTVEFSEDRTFTYLPGFVMNMTAEGIDGSGTPSGSTSGTWDASEGIIVTNTTANDLSVDVRVNGVSSGAMGADLIGQPIVDMPYDCASDTPVLFFGDGSSSRVPMKLTPV